VPRTRGPVREPDQEPHRPPAFAPAGGPGTSTCTGCPMRRRGRDRPTRWTALWYIMSPRPSRRPGLHPPAPPAR